MSWLLHWRSENPGKTLSLIRGKTTHGVTSDSYYRLKSGRLKIDFEGITLVFKIDTKDHLIFDLANCHIPDDDYSLLVSSLGTNVSVRRLLKFGVKNLVCDMNRAQIYDSPRYLDLKIYTGDLEHGTLNQGYLGFQFYDSEALVHITEL